MSSFRIAGLALAAALGSGSLPGQASALPANGLAPAATQAAAGVVENVAYVCGPYRCWWRPGPYWGPGPFWGPRPYWGPRPFWGPGPYWRYRYWGWRRPWWGWRRRWW